MNFSGRTISLMLVSALALLSVGGCASWFVQPQARTFTIDNTWVRQTTKREFLGFRRMNRMSPIVVDNRVIEANAVDGITAYDRKTGGQQWRLDIANGVEGGAEVSGDRLYFGASDGQFYCVSINDGSVVWTFPMRSETLAPPSVENGVVYTQSGADVVYALDAKTGKQLWVYTRQIAGTLSIRATTRPVVAGESLIVGFSDGFVVALKKRDGSLSWEHKLGKSPRFRDVDATPVIDGKVMYVASFDSALYSLDVDSGTVNWSIEDGAYVPVTVGTGAHSDRLYYATAGGKLMIVDKEHGKILRSLDVAHGIATQPVVYHDQLIYGESEGNLVFADAETLAPRAHFSSGLGLVSRPTVVETTGETYFISNTATLYALKLGYRQNSERLPWQTIN